MKNMKKILWKVLQPFRALWKYIITGNNGIKLYNIKEGVLELKRTYRRSFVFGIIFSVALHISFAGAFFITSLVNSEDSSDEKSAIIREINIVELPPPVTLKEETFIAPPEPPKTEKVTTIPKKDLKAFEPAPVKKENAEEQTVKTQQELEEINTPVSKVGDTTDFVYTGELGYVEEKKIEEKIEEKKIEPVVDNKNYSSFEVEKAPDAVNLSQVKGSIDYPEIAIQAGIEGRVTVKVLVNKQGRVVDIGKITGPVVFHDEVSEKVRKLQFTPGLQNGKPVNVWVIVPFSFNLN